MRFDRAESPPHVNEGKGWDVNAARAWLVKHDLINDDLTEDGEFLRFRQFKGTGKGVDIAQAADGVVFLRCEKSD